MPKYLYIHLPFCKKFCPYCDFKKCLYNEQTADKYIVLVINYLKKHYSNNKFKTIYLGGGTPNCLNDKQLDKLLFFLKNYLQTKYEFTIECNPEFITKKQVEIFAKNEINRISLGIQTLNKNILKTIGRNINKNLIKNVIELCLKAKITNLSCDLIYGFTNQTNKDIKNDIDFLIDNNVKHLSLYSLEINDDCLWKKTNYQINEEQIENHLKFIIKYLKKKKFGRYEVSNWAKNINYQSQHNVAVWQTFDWIGIGWGAYGLENKRYYHFSGNILKWKLIKEKYNNKNLYFHVLSMGLRLKNGLNLLNPLHRKVYLFYKNTLNNNLIKKKSNKLICVDLNILNNLLTIFVK